MELNLSGNMKIKTVEDVVEDVFGIRVQLKTDQDSNDTFAKIGGRKATEPLMVEKSNILLTNLSNKFASTFFRGEKGVELQFIDPVKSGDKKLVFIKDPAMSLGRLQNMYLPENAKKLLDKIKTSPLYHLSTSSKELFHSNFIYWLSTNNKTKPVFEKLIKRWIGQKGPGRVAVLEVSRENRNLDLQVKYEQSSGDTEYTLVIENKVKSIPTEEQLKDYQEKFSNGEIVQFLLLTISPFEISSEELKKWKVCRYGEFVRLLQEHSEDMGIRGYERQLIDDYCDFTEALYDLFELVHKRDAYFLHPALEARLKELRIHDLFLKQQSSRLAQKIHEKLKEDPLFKDKELLMGRFKDVKEKSKKVWIESEFLRGTAICSLFYLSENGVFAGVQVDSNDLRISVRAKENNVKNIADELFKKIDIKSCDGELGFVGLLKGENLGDYLRFKDQDKFLFIYKHRRLEHSDFGTIDALADELIRFFIPIYENRDILN